MFIEQIIEFELSEPGSWSFMYSKNWLFFDKTKPSTFLGGFCLQVFPLPGPPLRVDYLGLMGNMRQVSFSRTQGRIAVTNS